MSDTNVQNVDPNTMFDLFPDLDKVQTNVTPKFGMGEGVAVDLFNTNPAPPPTSTSTTDQTTQAPAADPTVTATGTPPPADPQTQSPAGEEGDTDILGTTGVQPPPTGQSIADLATYYQDRIKNGKFVAIEDQDDKGNPVPFIPKTPEEYDEVLELQIKYRLDKERETNNQRWYAAKSPAWKVAAQYAELLDDPADLIPFLQGVRTIQSVANIDENDKDGAEQIVRTRLALNGDTEEIIAQQIDALKTTDKLVSTAKLYKPVIIQQEQYQLQNELRQRQEEERNYQLMIRDLRESAIQSIEKPVFGKTKLKQEEKAMIYDLIAEPAEDTQGYAIYTAIDKLFETKDFERLKELALFIANRDAFMNYLGTNVANATAASLERKLRLAGDARTASGNNFHEDGNQQPRVPRNQFKKPTFGRGQ